MTEKELIELKRAKFIIEEFLNDRKDYEDLAHAFHLLNEIVKKHC